MIVCLMGPSASGKSTLAKSLESQHPERFARVPVDYFFVPRTKHQSPAEYFASPLAYDWTAVHRALCTRSGEERTTPDCDFELTGTNILRQRSTRVVPSAQDTGPAPHGYRRYRAERGAGHRRAHGAFDTRVGNGVTVASAVGQASSLPAKRPPSARWRVALRRCRVNTECIDIKVLWMNGFSVADQECAR